MAALFRVFQVSPGSLKLSESLDFVYPSERQELTEIKQTFATKITSQLDPSPSNFVTIF